MKSTLITGFRRLIIFLGRAQDSGYGPVLPNSSPVLIAKVTLATNTAASAQTYGAVSEDVIGKAGGGSPVV